MGHSLNYARQTTTPVGNKEDLTPKGNKRYRFSSVTKEEIEKLRVNVYPYLL